MTNYLVSISDRLVQIDPRGLCEMEDLMRVIASFGFTESSADLPDAARQLLDAPHRLGLFRDDISQYWLAEFKKQTELIDVVLIGDLDNLQTIAKPVDIDAIKASRPYIALLDHLHNHQADLKHDRDGTYQRLYDQARALLDDIENGAITDENAAMDALGELCRDFWQSKVSKSEFDPGCFREMLPQNHQLSENKRYNLIADKKIAWVGDYEETESAWRTALNYEEFRHACPQIAAWALNVMF